MTTERLLVNVAQEYCESKPTIRCRRTWSLMLQAVKRFGEFLGRDALLSDLTDKNIVAYIKHREAMGLAAASIERECSKLFSLWRWSAARGWMPSLPTIMVPKAALPVPKAWSKEEIWKLLKAARSAEGKFGEVPKGIFFYCLLLLAWETGERVGAIRSLRWDDIDFADRWVLFRGITRKGSHAPDNQQRISRKLAKALLELQEVQPHETPFGHRHQTTMYFHLKGIHKAAGLPYDRHCMLHRLRRSHATWLYVAGGDATVSLGHSSDYITRKRYLDPRFIRKTFGADLLQGWFARAVGKLRAAFGL